MVVYVKKELGPDQAEKIPSANHHLVIAFYYSSSGGQPSFLLLNLPFDLDSRFSMKLYLDRQAHMQSWLLIR
jgi:hypothetical protein